MIVRSFSRAPLLRLGAAGLEVSRTLSSDSCSVRAVCSLDFQVCASECGGRRRGRGRGIDRKNERKTERLLRECVCMCMCVCYMCVRARPRACGVWVWVGGWVGAESPTVRQALPGAEHKG